MLHAQDLFRIEVHVIEPYRPELLGPWMGRAHLSNPVLRRLTLHPSFHVGKALVVSAFDRIRADPFGKAHCHIQLLIRGIFEYVVSRDPPAMTRAIPRAVEQDVFGHHPNDRVFYRHQIGSTTAHFSVVGGGG